MAVNVFNVRFMRGPRLGENERYYPWDEDCWGTAAFEPGAVSLNGKHKTGAGVDLLTLGPAQSLLKGSIAKSLSEVIPVSDLARVVIRQRHAAEKSAAFRLYRKQDDGTLVVHSFVAGLVTRKGELTAADAVAALVSVVPAGIVTYEGAGPVAAAPAADWYPDPLGNHQFRFWDGASWTAQVADDGRQSVDPLQAEG